MLKKNAIYLFLFVVGVKFIKVVVYKKFNLKKLFFWKSILPILIL